MKAQELRVIDKTAGDANQVTGTVIIHDTVGGEPSIIAYNADIEFALEEVAGPLPEGYEYLPEECANAWKTRADWVTMEGLKDALGVRIEHFEDFLKETDWIYPDDFKETPEQEQEATTMDMIKITNERNKITLTIPQGMFWLSYGCWLDGKYRAAAMDIDKALCNDDRDRAQELLSRYDCVIEFDYDEENENNDR